jgi:hypothetical protein
MQNAASRNWVPGASFLLYASAQFFFLTILAMFVYPGGAAYVSNSDHYLFFQNFFSDLGATRTYSRKNNLVSAALFIVALVSLGLGLAASAAAWSAIVGAKGQARNYGSAARVFVILSGLGFIGVAATPWNLLLVAHNYFVQAAFSSLLGFIVSLTVLQIKNDWPKRHIVSNCFYMVLLAIYVFILFKGPRLDTASRLAFQVAAQKIITYVSILNLTFQAIGLRSGAVTAAENRNV